MLQPKAVCGRRRAPQQPWPGSRLFFPDSGWLRLTSDLLLDRTQTDAGRDRVRSYEMTNFAVPSARSAGHRSTHSGSRQTKRQLDLSTLRALSHGTLFTAPFRTLQHGAFWTSGLRYGHSTAPSQNRWTCGLELLAQRTASSASCRRRPLALQFLSGQVHRLAAFCVFISALVRPYRAARAARHTLPFHGACTARARCAHAPPRALSALRAALAHLPALFSHLTATQRAFIPAHCLTAFAALHFAWLALLAYTPRDACYFISLLVARCPFFPHLPAACAAADALKRVGIPCCADA